MAPRDSSISQPFVSRACNITLQDPRFWERNMCLFFHVISETLSTMSASVSPASLTVDALEQPFNKQFKWAYRSNSREQRKINNSEYHPSRPVYSHHGIVTITPAHGSYRGYMPKFSLHFWFSMWGLNWSIWLAWPRSCICPGSLLVKGGKSRLQKHALQSHKISRETPERPVSPRQLSQTAVSDSSTT